ncbi:MAG TPA: hypothetical protein VNB64_09375 [Solirubrobacteraceae bacterium]|nr:hypothetical protein [Solirubrobacteraceae bacterium]
MSWQMILVGSWALIAWLGLMLGVTARRCEDAMSGAGRAEFHRHPSPN